jgi:integrase
MRHSYASALLNAGVPIQEVSKLLGHADPSITLRIYAHVLPESEKGTAKKLDEIFATIALPRSPVKEER